MLRGHLSLSFCCVVLCVVPVTGAGRPTLSSSPTPIVARSNPEVPAFPPLPIVQELSFFGSTLFSHQIDDLCEDVAKIGLVYTSFSAGWWVTGGSTVGGIVSAVTLYRSSDAAADFIGDTAEVVYRWLALFLFGIDIVPPPRAPKKRVPRSFVGRFTDDFVEDSFKGLCLASHWHVGGMLAGSVEPVLRQRLRSLSIGSDATGIHPGAVGATMRYLARLGRRIIAVGHSAGSYSDCNAYADYLGDVAQAKAELAAGRIYDFLYVAYEKALSVCGVNIASRGSGDVIGATRSSSDGGGEL